MLQNELLNMQGLVVSGMHGLVVSDMHGQMRCAAE